MSELCLHVIVNDALAENHEGVLRDGIEAFLGFSELALGDLRAREEYMNWSTPEMRKVVRRARGAAWGRARAGAYYSTDRVAIWLPTMTDDIPRDVKRLQVSGTDYPRSGVELGISEGFVVSVNPNVTMTTGKSVAQALHAVHSLVLAVHTGRVSLDEFSLERLPSWKVSLGSAFSLNGDIVVRDAGHTEIDSGTATVSGAFFL